MTMTRIMNCITIASRCCSHCSLLCLLVSPPDNCYSSNNFHLLMLLVAVACCMAIAANTITICHNDFSIKCALPYCQLIVDIFFLLLNQICTTQMKCHFYSLSLGPSMPVDCFFLSNILYFAIAIIVTACALHYCCHLPPVQFAGCNLCQSAATFELLSDSLFASEKMLMYSPTAATVTFTAS